jgi:hypothetical protein
MWAMRSVMYITEMHNGLRFGICLGQVGGKARPDQLITFTGCLHEGWPIEDRDLSSAALDQACMFQFSRRIRDGWPLNAQHFGKKALRDRQLVPVAAVTHHEQPTREPLREAVGAIARDRHHDLLEKGLDVGLHEAAKGRHRCHGAHEGRARHPSCAPGNLDVEASGRTLGAEDRLHPGASLPADRCHLDGSAVGIDRHDRYHAAVREKYVVERTIGIHKDLLAPAANRFKLRQKLLEIASWRSKQKAIAGPT